MAVTSTTLAAAVPAISGVTMAQNATRLVTITYTLADAPAARLPIAAAVAAHAAF